MLWEFQNYLKENAEERGQKLEGREHEQLMDISDSRSTTKYNVTVIHILLERVGAGVDQLV